MIPMVLFAKNIGSRPVNLLIAWLVLLLLVTPITWIIFQQRKDKILQLRGVQKVLEKSKADLQFLKSQINPHFLFNTLNNLYALALDNSEKTPEVIERLSGILDYILYRCKANYVPVRKEIELLENYIALEKIRYGKRVVVNFDHQVDTEANIAPLLLLTFVENAFKHGVSQELKKAEIEISLVTEETDILFSIQNTKPKNSPENSSEEPLGLKNVRQQLELLYPGSHDLSVSEKQECYEARLKLKRK